MPKDETKPSSGLKRSHQRKQHRMYRAMRKVDIWLGPAIAGAVLLFFLVVIVCTFVIYYSERSANPTNVHSAWDGFRWVFLTLTIGKPFTLISGGAKTAQLFVSLMKPLTFAVLTAAVTSQVFHLVQRRATGQGRARVKDHLVICGWSSKGAEILKEIRGRDDQESQRRAVVLAPLKTDPAKDELTTFISGDPSNATDLKRAGIEQARTAIVLADNSYPGIDIEDMDSRTLLTVLAIETIAPQVYTCVEVIHSENREHFARTHADELVISAHLAGALLANSAVARGLARVVNDLVTFPEGNEFYSVTVGAKLAGSTFADALASMKREQNSIILGVATGEGAFDVNPDANRLLAAGDRLLVIAVGEPKM